MVLGGDRGKIPRCSTQRGLSAVSVIKFPKHPADHAIEVVFKAIAPLGTSDLLHVGASIIGDAISRAPEDQRETLIRATNQLVLRAVETFGGLYDK